MTKDEAEESDVWDRGDGTGPAVVQEESAERAAGKIYDLEERTARFGEAVIDLLKKVPDGPRTNRLIDQLTGCGTSVGANYGEADDAISKKAFLQRIHICRQEARECKHFLRMLARAVPALKPDARLLWQEANELHLIFAAICRRHHGK